MREFNILNKPVNFQQYRVKIQNQLSEKFVIEIWVRQGDSLSTILFNICLEKAIRSVEMNQYGIIYNRMKQYMAYAKDVVPGS